MSDALESWRHRPRTLAAVGTHAASDTAGEVQRRLVSGWRAMPVASKAALVDALSLDIAAAAETGIRLRHPGATPAEQLLRLGALRISGALMREAFGWDPRVRGY